VNNFSGLSARIFDRVIRPALVAASAAGEIGSVPSAASVVEACFRTVAPSEPPPNAPPMAVICRLSSRFYKSTVMKHRRAALVQSDHEKAARLPRLVVVEDLTPPALGLLKALKADGRVEKAWSVNGQVHYTLAGQPAAGVRRVRNVFDSPDSFLPPTRSSTPS